jgi:pimeloyl-ACP methyl ester carboxylesterase
VIKTLAANNPDVEVVTPAIPGCETEPPGAVPTLAYDELVAALRAQVEPKDRHVILVGLSFGALLALSLAATTDWTITNIVLFDPMVIPLLELCGYTEEYRTLRAQLDDYARGVQSGDPDAAALVIDAWLGVGAYEAAPERLREVFRLWGPMNLRDMKVTFDKTFDLEALSTIRARISAYYGAAGPPIWQAFAKSAASLTPGGTVEGIEGANHAMLVTHAEPVATAIAAVRT